MIPPDDSRALARVVHPGDAQLVRKHDRRPQFAEYFGSDGRPGIPPEDQVELRWYFQEGKPGAGSTGTEWERVQLYAAAAPPCERCGGDARAWRGGTGFIDSATGKATDDDAGVRRIVLELMGIDLGHSFGDQQCPACQGHGWLLDTKAAKKIKASRGDGSETAYPTGSSVELGNPATTPQGDLYRLTRISTWLWRVEGKQGDIPAGRAIERYFSQDEEDLRSLWPDVPAGKKLLRKNAKGLNPLEFLELERERQRKERDPNRQALFDAAELQVESLWHAAGLLWVTCAPAASLRPPPPPRIKPVSLKPPPTLSEEQERNRLRVEALRRRVKRMGLAS